MRLALIAMFISSINIVVFGSNNKQPGITLQLSEARIETALNSIEEQTSYYFLFNQNLVDLDQKISVQIENAGIEQVLEVVFSGLNVKYLIYGRQIILLPKVTSPDLVIEQQRNINGTVTDANTNEPLAGVHVYAEDSYTGIITNSKGEFSIELPLGTSSLLFSFVGYKTEKIYINNDTTINVALVFKYEDINEIIVIGYGIQDVNLVTGAISRIESSDMKNSSILYAQQSIQGRSSGIQVIPTSGAPGSKIKLRIRGYSSNGTSEPLFVIDGLRSNDISYLDPNDINSIEILKDGASAAIYGAEGGNGVVLITTKRGKIGSASLSYNFQLGWQNLARKPSLMNAAQYSVYMEEAGHLLNAPTDINTDWINELFVTSPFERHHISFSGGSETITYMLGLSYLDQDGIVKGASDRYKRYSLLFNSDYQAFDWFKVGTDISFAHTLHKTVTENNEYGSVITNTLMMDPLTPPIYKGYIPVISYKSH